ncbi:MAG: SCO family protein [Bdellovibrionaceae bacterium]|nr:SCO family protein [Bdellovibrionales bacterium]MCB9083759.1 SCO family protein [Pseudobdellovibrionaceae bacterium]
MEKSQFSIPAKLFFVFTFVVTLASLWMFLQERRHESFLGGDFTLNHGGEAWQFSDHSKDLNLLYIGYTKCPDVCPLRMIKIREALAELGAQNLEDVQPIFISVDTDNDKPEEVSAYAQYFLKGFVGLTGTQTEVNKAISLFGATYSKSVEPNSELGYSYIHTDRLYFLDRKGRVLDSLVAPTDAAEILAKVKELL